MSTNLRMITSFIGIVLLTLLPALSQERNQKRQPIQKRRTISRPVDAKPGAVVRNQLGMELVYVPAGSFKMGSNHFARGMIWGSLGEAVPVSGGEWAIYEEPVHQVTIKEGFYMGRYEVTQAEWQRVMGANPSYVKGENLPVEMVTWEEAQSFLKKLNERRDGFRYRLPSEAEWEYACRAGMTGDYPEDLEDVAWYANNSGKTSHPVGTKQANSFGLYDMLGNVWEWCEDTFHPTYDGAPSDGSPWLSGEYSNVGTKEANLYRRSRVWRGGSWNWGADSARCASRNYYFQGSISPHQGFRVVAISRVIPSPAKGVTKRSIVVRRAVGSGPALTWSSNSRIVFERWLKCSEEENRRSGTVGNAWGCSVELWAIRSDRSDPQRLTYGAKDTDPAWSPDGQNIAFSRSNHESGIYVIARDGTNLRRLTSVTEGDFATLCPQWVQDDRLIFSFTSEREPGWNLHSVRVDGHDEQVIKLGIANPFSTSVSANRRQVAFNGNDGAVYVATVNGWKVRRLQTSGYPHSWFPDSIHLVVGQTTGACLRVNTVTSIERALGGIQECNITWSPDGRRAVYQFNDAIWIMDANGQNKRLLAQPKDNSLYRNPVWSPN